MKKKPSVFGTRSKLCMNFYYWAFETRSHYAAQAALEPATQPRL